MALAALHINIKNRPLFSAQSKGDPEVGTKEFVSIVRTDPFSRERRGFQTGNGPRVSERYDKLPEPCEGGDFNDGLVEAQALEKLSRWVF